MALMELTGQACLSLPGLKTPGAALLIRSIISRAERLRDVSDEHLQQASQDLMWQSRSGVPEWKLLASAFAMLREAARRVHGLEHYPVQLRAALSLARGGVAEMQTGEGKSLTALAPAYLYALAGKGCHVLTSNDYLAERDASFARPVLEMLGLRVGFLRNDKQPDERRSAYQCDITYGTEKEMGFDFLRDRLQKRQPGSSTGSAQRLQRGHYFALVDEADSIMIDQARTPLLIADRRECSREESSMVSWSHSFAGRLTQGVDYQFQPEKGSATLTRNGCHRVLLASKPRIVAGCDAERLYQQVERSLAAQLVFQADRDYVVIDGKVQIVDESTGRILEGRKWQDGLHQAVEVKEQLDASELTHENARITVQSYLNRYTYLAGMTGTAWPVRRELKRVFGVHVARIPTHRPCRRTQMPPRIFCRMEDKLRAVAESVESLQQDGRAILIGTPSVSASESLSSVLTEVGIQHQVLHARNDAAEAAIITAAGNPGNVVVATNMAGRGTDIKIADSVRQKGGLHVIATELHSSPRIDRQLIGRTARQGDPGSWQLFLSFEDELFRQVPNAGVARLAKRARPDARGEVSSGYLAEFERTRRCLEKMHERQRRQLLKREKQVYRLCHDLSLDPWLESFDMNQAG